MCWLHVTTNGKAKLDGCPESPHSAIGNKVGTIRVDYWLSSDLATGGFKEFIWRFYIDLLRLFHWKKHQCDLVDVYYKPHCKCESRFCRGCGRFEDPLLSTGDGLGKRLYDNPECR